MTREEAWKKAVDEALRAFRETSQRDRHGVSVTSENLMGGLYAGLRVVRAKMTANTLITNDLTQLISIALDCLGAAYYDADARGEKPMRPSERRN